MALADISGFPKGPCQLIAAVPHLVAWLVNSGLTMFDGAGAGPARVLGTSVRWLSTLWQWGHVAKLGRVV
ncbi:MAG: hypothetical protein Q7O66_23425 [Dehalococcoidia bacterium]|nr:hypothetical protein [Dehalococcoidia bacterium]